MNYIQHVNSTLRAIVERSAEPLVLFGQNLAAGSRIGGLGAGLGDGPNRRVINTPNAENTQVGMGLGLMLSGVNSIFMMKQQDFLLLGLDHVVNTYNALRRTKPAASFTILAIVVDSGWEGPQSCLDNLSDLCSLARVPGYVATNRLDVERVFAAQLIAPGFRLLGISQRLFRQDVIEPPGPITADARADIIAYAHGKDATIVAFNFAFPQALELFDTARAAGASPSLFSVNAALPESWTPILDDLRTTGRLVVVDDSKSANRTSDRLIAAAAVCPVGSIVAATREFSDSWFRPNADTMSVDAAAVLKRLGIAARAAEKVR
jgi:pyruvate dehydrogenase E1 component beta subunit